jgi:CubicO group peptidase (beta-lactamase class C family)
VPAPRTWPLSALLASALLAGCSSPPAPAYPSAVQAAEDAAYDVLRQHGASSLGIAIVNRSGLAWTRSFGLADVATGTPPTPETRFGIGSVSKMFAAVAVMQLAERGLVELEAPLVRYLPGFRMEDPRYDRITVRMLLDHSSGIAGTTFRSGFTFTPVGDYPQQLLETLSHERLKADPGRLAVYCNDGFTLVEALVAAVTGKTYSDHVQAEILEPLGMVHSAFPVAPFPEGSYARAYLAGELQPQDFTNLYASGGLYTTPTDLAAFARVFLDGGVVAGHRVLGEASVERMAVDQTADTFDPVHARSGAYGLGWDTVTVPSLAALGIPGWTKNGGSFFYAAQLLVAPRDGLAVVVMGTTDRGFDPLGVAERVLLRALVDAGRIPAYPAPLPAVAAPEAPVPDGLLASMAGLYAMHQGIRELRAEADGSLSLVAVVPPGLAPDVVGLRYRTDGWFTAASNPLESYRVVDGEGTPYLAKRTVVGPGTVLDEMAMAERVRGTDGGLSPAWEARVGRRWLVVNEHPASQLLARDAVPVLAVSTLPSLPGRIVVLSPLLGHAQTLDPSGSDVTARMMLAIPTNNGRDLNDLDVVPAGGEEWVRWGGFLGRPLETVPVLPSSASSRVDVGPEGHGEWRGVDPGGGAATVSIAGAHAWRLYDSGFGPLGSGGASGSAVLPAGSGPGWLLVYGAAGSSVGVTVTPAAP